MEAADYPDVEPELAVGSEAFVIVRGPGGEPEVFDGFVVAFDDGALVIRPVATANGHEPLRGAARETVTPRPIVQRRSEGRYPTWIEGTIYPEGSRKGQPAVISDLSTHGASVETSEWGHVARFRLTIPYGKRTITVEGSIVGEDNVLRGVLLHTRFGHLDERERQMLADIVDVNRATFAEAQEHLATKHIGPNHG